MLQYVERVQIIDSLIVDADSFFKYFKKGRLRPVGHGRGAGRGRHGLRRDAEDRQRGGPRHGHLRAGRETLGA